MKELGIQANTNCHHYGNPYLCMRVCQVHGNAKCWVWLYSGIISDGNTYNLTYTNNLPISVHLSATAPCMGNHPQGHPQSVCILPFDPPVQVRRDAPFPRNHGGDAYRIEDVAWRELLELPAGPLQTIAHMAGRDCREVCKGLAHAYGPPRSPVPSKVPDFGALVAALRKHGGYLRVLDLSRVYAGVVQGTSHVRALCDALPHLQELRLPRGLTATHAEVAAAATGLTSLTSLVSPSRGGAREATDTEPSQQQLSSSDSSCMDIIMQLPQIRDLTMPLTPGVIPASNTTTIDTSAIQLTRLCLRAWLARGEECDHVALSDLARLARQLPSLVVLELDALEGFVELHGAAHDSQLQGLHKLTALQLAGFMPAEAAPTGQLLNQLRSLAGLRRLHLHILRTGWTSAQRGWLTRMSLLTSLDVCFESEDDGELCAWGAFDDVASAVAHLPALRSLRIADGPYDDHDTELDAITAPAFKLLASAKSRLILLHLEHCALPATAMDTISTLTSLTSLKLLDCAPLLHCNGMGGLTSLRELIFSSRSEMVPAIEQITCLTNVEVLVLRDGGLDSSYFTQLCHSLPQLRVLDIGRNNSMEYSTGCGVGEGVAELSRLTNLEVVDLSGAVSWWEVCDNMRVPYSLTRLHLGHFDKAYGGQRSIMHFQKVREALRSQGCQAIVERRARKLDPTE
jgi:hypothetical protein